MNRSVASQCSHICAIFILVTGVLLGVSDIRLPLRQMHLAMAVTIILMVPLMLYVHIKRFYSKGAFDWIAWTHFVLFAVFIGLAIRMVRHWYPTVHDHDAHFENHRHQLYWNRKPINMSKLRDYVSRHPGGKNNIEKVFNKKYNDEDLEAIWQKEGVSWHKTNSNVNDTLTSMV